jgi:hypothetical protein
MLKAIILPGRHEIKLGGSFQQSRYFLICPSARPMISLSVQGGRFITDYGAVQFLAAACFHYKWPRPYIRGDEKA